MACAQQTAQPQTAAPASQTVDLSTYRIYPEDTITVTTRDLAEMSGDFLVRTDGFITFPVIKDVKVAGLTTDEVSKLLVKLLAKELVNPVITVNIKSLGERRVYVMGAVHTPGVLDWKPGWRLTEAMSAAGGVSDPPERVAIHILRGPAHIGPIQVLDLLTGANGAKNLAVEPGDTINFQSDVSVRVSVVGSVAKPGVTLVLKGQGVVEALAAAGGGTADARLSAAKITRDGKDIPIDLFQAITKAHPELDIPVQDGDTIYVPALTDHIAVLGMVAKPGSVVIPDGKPLTLSEAIGLAGGPTAGAKLDAVSLVHPKQAGNGKPEVYNFSAIVKDRKSLHDPVLSDGDIVYVSQSGKPHLGDFGSALGILTFLRLFIP